jgi:subtilisin family serine protease
MSVVFIVVVVIGLSAGLLASTGTPVPEAHATTGLASPLASTSALTHTTFLPVILSCYPLPGPDPYYQSDMNIINADDAWRRCDLNASSVVIAIIDSGVDLDHPDLQANLRAGFDFVEGDAVPEDGDGHGANVAGIAAAALNGIGVAGVAPTAKILPVRVLDDNGSGYLSDIADGIIYAADRAQVLNLSLGGTTNSSTMLNAITYAAVTKGRLVIAAAGNCGDSNYLANGCAVQNQTFYPAAYSNAMAVAATTIVDTRASFSNVGSYVDIAAPGVGILNTYIGNNYASFNGTSQAAPHVAGLAALVWARNPGYTASQVWSRIAATAVDLGATGIDQQFGAGRIDVKQALGLTTLQAALPEVNLAEAAAAPVIDQREAPIAPGRIIVKFKDNVSAAAESAVLSALPNAVVVESIPAIDAQVVSVPQGAEWVMVDRLRAQPGVEYVEPDYLLHAIR